MVDSSAPVPGPAGARRVCFSRTSTAPSRLAPAPIDAPPPTQAAGRGRRAAARHAASDPGSQPRVDVLIDGKPFTSYIWPTTLKKPVLYPLRPATGRGDAGLSARAAAGRARRPSPSRRALVQLRRRERPRLLEQLRRHPRRAGAARWARSSTARRKAKSGAARASSRAEGLGHARRQAPAARGHDFRLPRHGARRARSIASRRSPRSISEVSSPTTRKACSACASREPRAAVGQARDLHRRERQSHRGSGARQHGRHGPLHQQRGQGATPSGARAASGRCSRGRRGEPVTLAILDHPTNPGYPTYWHARGYGLFAANPSARRSSRRQGEAELHAWSPARTSCSATGS